MPETYLPRPGTLSTRQTYRYDGDDAHSLAIARTRDYLTPKQCDAISEGMACSPPFRAVRLWLCMTGVEGYPVKAMLREYHPRYVRRFGAASTHAKHDWQEAVDDDGELAEPAYDVCVQCGARRD